MEAGAATGRGQASIVPRQRRAPQRHEYALGEIEHYALFDYMVVNDEVERAFDHIQGIILAERCKRVRRAELAESLLRHGTLSQPKEKGAS